MNNQPPTNPTPFDGYEIPDVKLSTDLTDDSFFWSPRDGEWLSTFPLSDSMIEGMILVDARFCRKIQPATKQEPQPFEIDGDPFVLVESDQIIDEDCAEKSVSSRANRWYRVSRQHIGQTPNNLPLLRFAKPFTPESQVENSNGMVRDGWVKCPICGESDMQRDKVPDEDLYAIFCTNHACASNGGDNWSELQALADKEKQPTEPNSMSILIDACDDHIAEGEKLLNGPGAVGVLVHPYIKSEIEVSRKLKAWLSGEGNR